VLGDPAFVDRVAAAGVGTVALAAAYHSTRAATPLHPRHQLVDARYAALYRPVRDVVWRGRELSPREPDWMPTPDSFGVAAAELRAAGLRVSAWIVLTHNSGLGAEGVSVVNCFGERYRYALCPAHPEVREYAALLAGEAVAGAEVDAVSLEACGQLGLTHLSHHEKTDGAWTAAATRWLSVCCCPACRAAWSARGLDPAHVVDTLRAAVRAEAQGGVGEVPMADALLAARHAAADALRAEVLEHLRTYAPEAPVTLHAHPDPWVTGASPGLTPTAAADVAALMVPAWPTIEESADVVAAAVATGRDVDAYVTVLAPAEPAELPAHVARLRAAGATGLSLYHLGLAPSWRQPLFREVADGRQAMP
jgi:hypothetical protein